MGGEGIKYCRKRGRRVDKIATEMNYDLISIPASLLGYAHRRTSPRMVTTMIFTILCDVTSDGGIFRRFPTVP